MQCSVSNDKFAIPIAFYFNNYWDIHNCMLAKQKLMFYSFVLFRQLKLRSHRLGKAWSCVLDTLSVWQSPFGSHPLMVILWWSPFDGHPLMVILWWSSFDGHLLMVILWWSPFDGHPLMVTLWWSSFDGHPMMVILWWSSFDSHPLTVTLCLQ